MCLDKYMDMCFVIYYIMHISFLSNKILPLRNGLVEIYEFILEKC